ncbi:MAG: hypothetical protein HPY82_05965 [Gammaproteobacteria bacterium]|nr:hypothetical protein [Gammaproteobacteria bacterium]
MTEQTFPACRLCKREPLIDTRGFVFHLSRRSSCCPIRSSLAFTPAQWTALMGAGGEPVGVVSEWSIPGSGRGFSVEWNSAPSAGMRLYTQAPAVDDTGFGGQPLVNDDEQTALNKLERFLQYVHLTIDSMDSARVTLGEIHCEARELMKELNLNGEG